MKQFIKIVGGKPGVLMVAVEANLEALEYFLYCYDTQYKNKEGFVKVLVERKVGMEVALSKTALEKVKRNLKARAIKAIKKIEENR